MSNGGIPPIHGNDARHVDDRCARGVGAHKLQMKLGVRIFFPGDADHGAQFGEFVGRSNQDAIGEVHGDEVTGAALQPVLDDDSPFVIRRQALRKCLGVLGTDPVGEENGCNSWSPIHALRVCA